MINNLKSIVSHNVSNALGWRTNRKIVVIESDDWGSVRMPNKKTYNKLLNKGVRIDLCPYNKYDTLANIEDFEALFNLLNKHSDYKGNHPVITVNTNVANPNFEQIREENFTEYYFESFLDTLKRYYPNQNVFGMWQEGIDKKFIYPQLHGREHLNPIIWLNLIKEGSVCLKEAFDLELFGLSFATTKEIKIPFLASLIYKTEEEKRSVEKSVIESADIFEKIFKFRSLSFIAPLYTWNSELESVFNESGIRYIQAANRHKTYDFSAKKFKRIYHITGNQNKFGQIYMHRNCTFEPAVFKNKDNVSDCLKQIENSFFWKKPAVISMHRLNFIGGLEERNRIENFKMFDNLLNRIKQKWKDVEFLHSSELGDLIKNSYD